jgi:alkanesulfonate monooxygenase SsuD/methylene tetrahydromethanopterin reductase-like flavin-dependent oxidoreductase (luciferase family)
VPRPLQQPHPEIRIAASQHETYATIGELGYPLFSAVRLDDARDGMMRFSTYRADLIRGPLSYETVLREKVVAGTPEMVVRRLSELREVAQLAGISAEINPGSLLNHQQVMNSLRLYCLEVMPQFK